MKASKAAAALKAEVKVYSGSIEMLRGARVLSIRSCTCERCHPGNYRREYGRVIAVLLDPLTKCEETISHARPASVGLEPGEAYSSYAGIYWAPL